MSRKTTRHYVQQWLANPPIPGIGTVFPSPPKISRTSDGFEGAPQGTPSGSVIYVEVFDSHETRDAYGGPLAGKKRITHIVRLHLLFRSRQRKAEDAMDDHDDQLEAILARVRSDRTLGTALLPSPLLQAGEGDYGIRAQSGLPKTVGTGTVQVWTAIDFEAQEQITS